jgi:hypothetical protein
LLQSLLPRLASIGLAACAQVDQLHHGHRNCVTPYSLCVEVN